MMYLTSNLFVYEEKRNIYLYMYYISQLTAVSLPQCMITTGS